MEALAVHLYGMMKMINLKITKKYKRMITPAEVIKLWLVFYFVEKSLIKSHKLDITYAYNIHRHG